MFGIHSTSNAGQLLSAPYNLPLLWISQDRSVRLPSLFITNTCVVDTTITLKQMLRYIKPSSLRKLHSYGYLILNASTFIVGSQKLLWVLIQRTHPRTHLTCIYILYLVHLIGLIIQYLYKLFKRTIYHSLF